MHHRKLKLLFKRISLSWQQSLMFFSAFCSASPPIDYTIDMSIAKYPRDTLWEMSTWLCRLRPMRYKCWSCIVLLSTKIDIELCAVWIYASVAGQKKKETYDIGFNALLALFCRTMRMIITIWSLHDAHRWYMLSTHSNTHQIYPKRTNSMSVVRDENTKYVNKKKTKLAGGCDIWMNSQSNRCN